MASTRSTLAQLSTHLDESIGLRESETQPTLSPVASPRDIGRRPLRNVGRVEIERVVPDPDQPRVEFEPDAIERLADSIREKGQLAPIHVRWSRQLEKWLIISGERRWRATRHAGLPTIDCVFQDGELGSSEVLEQQLIENLLREDLKPIEQARAFQSLMDLNHWTGKQVAHALRIQPSTVSRALALLKLPQDVQWKVDAGELSARSAYEVSKLPNEEAHRRLADKVTRDKLTHGQAAGAVRRGRGKRRKNAGGTRLTFLAEPSWRITISSPRRGTYREVEQALEYALEDVRQRIRSNVQLL